MSSENVSSSPLAFSPPSLFSGCSSEELWKAREERQKQVMLEMFEREREEIRKERRELEEMILREREERKKEKEKMESEKLLEKEEKMLCLQEIRQLKEIIQTCMESVTRRLPKECSVRSLSSSPPPPPLPYSSSHSQFNPARFKNPIYPVDSTFIESLTFSSEYHCGAMLLSNNFRTATNVFNSRDARLVVIGNRKFIRGIVTVRIKVDEMSCPSGCVLGVLTELPSNFQNSFGYQYLVDGYGLHADRNKTGIYWNGELYQNAAYGFRKGDTVEMIFDILHGHLRYTVNGWKCSEIINNTYIKAGGYVAGTLRGNARWTIVLAEYKNRN